MIDAVVQTWFLLTCGGLLLLALVVAVQALVGGARRVGNAAPAVIVPLLVRAPRAAQHRLPASASQPA